MKRHALMMLAGIMGAAAAQQPQSRSEARLKELMQAKTGTVPPERLAQRARLLADGEGARVDDLDADVHLGDSIYEYDRGGYASQRAAELGRLSEPDAGLLTLAHYRRRHAQYRSDPDLQALTARVPLIAVRDDHEIANNAWRNGPENHQSATEGDWAARRAAAIRAHDEWLPIREVPPRRPERICRSFDFGTLLSLHMRKTYTATVGNTLPTLPGSGNRRVLPGEAGR